jgi:hypothetical protein
MAIIQDEQGNLIDTENRVQFGNENFDSEPYEYTPNYLGANSPMLSKGFQVLSETPSNPDMNYPYTTGRGDARLSSEQQYGYDPAFGDLLNYTRGPTSFTDRNTFMRDGKLQLINSGPIGYFDDYERVPSLQRALGNERFALAPEELTSQPQELGYIEPAAVPKEAIYQDRIMNRNLSNSNYEPKQGILQGLQSKIGAGFNNVKDFAIDKGRMGKNLIGAGAAKFAGLPGMVGSGLMSLLSNLRDPNAPSYQQYSPQSYLKENNLSNIYNANPSMINDFYDDNPDSDTFNTTRFDRATTAFGKSRALFGPNGIAATKAKMAAAKAAKAKAYKEKQAADAITAANNPYNPDGSRAAYNYAGRDNAQGTHTSTMSNTQAQANQDRGRGKYNQGGLASMFTRRR